jgi:hypothetical protein
MTSTLSDPTTAKTGGNRMMGHEKRWVDCVARGLDGDAPHIADAIVSALREIEAALHPVIGRGGFDALQTRAVYLAGLPHPWLAGARGPASSPVNMVALRSVLTQQTSAEAAAGAIALLQTFDRVLTTLIGRPLTERLLRCVALRPLTPGGAAAQDTLP